MTQDEAFSRDLLSNPRFGQLRSIKYLCVKNLAHLAEQSGQLASAVQWYGEAVGLDEREFVVWYKLGCVAFQAAKMNVSRLALERAASMRPQHIGCLEILCEVLFAVGDFPSCLATAAHILQHDGSHPRARLFQALIMRSRLSSKYEGEELLDDVLQQEGMKEYMEQLETWRAKGLYSADSHEHNKQEAVKVELISLTWEEILLKTLHLYRGCGSGDPGSIRSLNAPVSFRLGDKVEETSTITALEKSRLGPSQCNANEANCLRCAGDSEGPEDELLLCENLEQCGGAFHLTCLTAPNGPLERAPPSKVKWFCPSCALNVAPVLPSYVKKRLLESVSVESMHDGGAAADDAGGGERPCGTSSPSGSPAKKRRSRGMDPARKSQRHTDQSAVPAELQAQLGRFLRFVRHGVEDGRSGALGTSELDAIDCDDTAAEHGPKKGSSADEGAELTRFAMLQRVPDVLSQQADDVRSLVMGLPRPCGLSELLRRLVEALAAVASRLRVRGRLLDLLLEADSVAAGALMLSPTAHLALAELQFDAVLRIDRLNDAVATAGAGPGEDAVEAARGELPAPLRHHLALLSPGELPDASCRARQAWLIARVWERQQRHGQAVAALDGVRDWLGVLGADGPGCEVILPSCVFGNLICAAAVQRRLSAPRAGAEADSVERIYEDLRHLAARAGAAGDSAGAAPASVGDAPVPAVAEAGDEGTRNLIAHAMAVLAPGFRADDPAACVVRKLPPRKADAAAAGPDEDRRWDSVELLFAACCRHPEYAPQALYALNLLLAGVVGMRAVLDEGEDPILYRPIGMDQIRRAGSAVEMARAFAKRRAATLRAEAEGGPAGSAALRQLEVQLGRLLVRLGVTPRAGQEFHAASMALLELRSAVRPNEPPGQRQELMAACMEELFRRGVVNLNGGEFFRVYLPLLRQLRQSEPPAVLAGRAQNDADSGAAGADGMASKGKQGKQGAKEQQEKGEEEQNEDGDGDEEEEEEEEEEGEDEDRIGAEIARCYYAMYGLQIPGHKRDYEALDALIPREEDPAAGGGGVSGRLGGRSAVRSAPLVPGPEVCAELFELVRPHAERALKGRRPEPGLKECLEVVERLLPEPPLDVAPAAALVRQFACGEDDGEDGASASALTPDFAAALRAWESERRGPAVSQAAAEAAPAAGIPALDSDVIMIDDDDDDPAAAAAAAPAASPAAAESTGGADGPAGMHGAVYRMLAGLLERRVGADAAADERVAELYLRDLAVCPTRAASWLGAARAFKKALLGCPAHGLRQFPAAHASPEARGRLRRAARAYSAVLGLRPGDPEASYGRGLMLYLMAQGGREVQSALARAALLEGALRDLEACLGQSGPAADWVVHYLVGKLGRKTGRPVREWLGRLVEAGRLNGEAGPLGIEPWYKLHASRAKHVLAAGPGGLAPADLDALAAHSLAEGARRADADGAAAPSGARPAASAAAEAALLEDARRQQAEAAERLAAAEEGCGPRFAAGSREAEVLEDVMVAMRVAVERARNQRTPWPFAKARHRLARVLADSRAGPDPVASDVVSDIQGKLFFNERDEASEPPQPTPQPTPNTPAHTSPLPSRPPVLHTIHSISFAWALRLRIPAATPLARCISSCSAARGRVSCRLRDGARGCELPWRGAGAPEGLGTQSDRLVLAAWADRPQALRPTRIPKPPWPGLPHPAPILACTRAVRVCPCLPLFPRASFIAVDGWVS